MGRGVGACGVVATSVELSPGAAVVAVAAAKAGAPVSVGDAENTKLVEDVPVEPAAVNPVMLLKRVIDALPPPVPPLLTANVPAQPRVWVETAEVIVTFVSLTKVCTEAV